MAARHAVFLLGGCAAFAMALLPLETSLATFLYEDLFYYLTLARHWVDGAGITLDGASPTNGFHPAWFLVCAALATFLDGAPLVHALLCVAASLHVAQGVVLYGILRATPRIALVVAGFWLLDYRVLASNLCGLETPLATLFAMLVLRELVVWTRAGRIGSGLGLGVLLGAAAASRFDLLLLCVGAAAWITFARALQATLRVRVSTVMRATVAALLVLAPWFAWSWRVSGSFLPHSREAIALVEAAHASDATGLAWLGERLLAGAWWASHGANLVGLWPLALPPSDGDGPVAWMLPATLLLAALVVLTLVVLRRRHEAAGGAALLLVAYAVLHSAWYVVFSRPEIRYLLPAWAALFAAAGLAAALHSDAGVRVRRAAVVGVALLYASAGVAGAFAFERGYGTTFTHPYHRLFHQAARDLDRSAPADAVFGAWNAGILSYFSNRRVVNLDGVVNDGALAALREERLLAYLRDERVTHVVDMPHQFARFFGPFGGEPTWADAFAPPQWIFEDAEGRRVEVRRVLEPRPR